VFYLKDVKANVKNFVSDYNKINPTMAFGKIDSPWSLGAPRQLRQGHQADRYNLGRALVGQLLSAPESIGATAYGCQLFG
jgi:hypothetical protein